MEGEDRERLDHLAAALDKAYHHPEHLVWRGFLIGLASGLGATIGVALVITLVGFILRQLGGVPFIGEWLNTLSQELPGSGLR